MKFQSINIRRHHLLMLMALISCFFGVQSVKAEPMLHVPQWDRVQSETSTRIIGGTAVPQGERTFQVALLTNGSLVCGGSIVADNWVMTAAHCVDGINITQILSDTQNLNQSGQLSSVAQVIIHPDWSRNNVGAGNDIALIRVNESFASHLERLKLATQSIMSSFATPGVNGIVSGWGLTSVGGRASSQLLQTDNTVISDALCNRLAGSIASSSIVCSNDPARSSCSGDSGGPYTVSSNGQTYSIGIVSFGPPSCRGYSAYTETAHFVSWVNQFIGTDTGDVDNQETELTNNSTVFVSGIQNERKYFTFTLPSSVSDYSVTISGGSGDADLYVRQGARPTDSQYDCRPFVNGNSESCTATSPSAGTYSVMLKGYRAFNGVSLTLSYGEQTPVSNACPADHQTMTGTIDPDGTTLVGGNYYFSQAGTHSAINLDGAISMELYNYRSRWVQVQSSTSQFTYQGSRGYYATLLRGASGTPYNVCVKMP